MLLAVFMLLINIKNVLLIQLLIMNLLCCLDVLGQGKLQFHYITIKKIYIVYHFEPLRKSRQLGYVKGDVTTKLLHTSSIGGILASKYGDLIQVQRMIEDGVLEIIPTANIRGIELKDCGVLVTEAQNIDTYTLKTIIQRCGENVSCCIEGDILEQKDIETSHIGIDRMIDVFKGNESFGCVKLKSNHRNPIGELADKM